MENVQLWFIESTKWMYVEEDEEEDDDDMAAVLTCMGWCRRRVWSGSSVSGSNPLLLLLQTATAAAAASAADTNTASLLGPAQTHPSSPLTTDIFSVSNVQLLQIQSQASQTRTKFSKIFSFFPPVSNGCYLIQKAKAFTNSNSPARNIYHQVHMWSLSLLQKKCSDKPIAISLKWCFSSKPLFMYQSNR